MRCVLGVCWPSSVLAMDGACAETSSATQQLSYCNTVRGSVQIGEHDYPNYTTQGTQGRITLTIVGLIGAASGARPKNVGIP